jgi:hypothetical protein
MAELINDFHDSKEILLHGPSSLIPWSKTNSAQQISYIREYEEWLRSDHYDEYLRLCFLDLLLPSLGDRVFSGMIAAPTEERWKCYVETLKRLLQGHVTVGSHEVFQVGLPVFEGMNRPPLTELELRESLIDSEIEKEGYLLWVDDSNDRGAESDLNMEFILQPPSSAENAQSWYAEIITAEKHFDLPGDPQGYKEWVKRSSEKSIIDNWGETINQLKAKKETLRNFRNEPLSVVIGLPICLRTHGSDRRTRHESVAQLFLGFGGNPDESKTYAFELARAISMHTFRAHATIRARQEGFQTGLAAIGHSLPHGIATAMENLIEYGQSHADFEVPVTLFQMAIDAAVAAGWTSSTALYKSVPRLRNLETRIAKEGMNGGVVEFLSEEIARKLAISRLANDPDPISQWEVKRPKILVTGALSSAELELRPGINLGVFISVLVLILKEAIEHTERCIRNANNNDGEVPNIHFVMCADSGLIEIKNPCSFDAQSLRISESNQAVALALLSKHISPWSVQEQEIRDGFWVRRLRKGQKNNDAG